MNFLPGRFNRRLRIEVLNASVKQLFAIQIADQKG